VGGTVIGGRLIIADALFYAFALVVILGVFGGEEIAVSS
jgi:hypothetical protein